MEKRRTRSDAASAMGITSDRLFEFGLVDEVIEEPLGGTHRDVEQMANSIKQSLIKTIDRLQATEVDHLLQQRYQRLMSYGQFKEV